jgi:hypothetical protein
VTLIWVDKSDFVRQINELCVIFKRDVNMKNVLIFILSIFLASCTKKEISVPDFVFTSAKDTSDIRLKYYFYGSSTFILMDSSKVFFHNKRKDVFCATFLDPSKPPRINLMPDDLKEINVDKLNSFLKIFRDSIDDDGRLLATIVSPKDTIKHKAFKILTNYFERNGFSKHYSIRKWTEEEEFALTAKIQKKQYHPNLVKWKIGFDSDYLESISIKK